MYFTISDIDYGWFGMEFQINEKKVKVAASNLNGNHAPKGLLLLLTDLITEKIGSGYVLFDEEYGISMISLEKEVFTLACLQYNGKENKKMKIPLQGNMTLDEISNLVSIDKICIQAEIDIKVFVKSVYRAFCRYAKSFLMYDKFEEQWDRFPQKEWDIFEQLILQKGWNKKD